MVVNLTINDDTQKMILEHLDGTCKLLSNVGTKLSKEKKEARIYAMPDLGIAQNGMRMIGGFYTGACYTWQSDVPFIPVDATVNVCGTAVYKLNKNISNEEFVERLNSVMDNRNTYLNFLNTYLPKNILNSIDVSDVNKFYWNYNKGNHFVIFAESDGKNELEKGQYMLVHASAIEFKKDNLNVGLYPVEGNWFYNDIKIEYDERTNRYLRYIAGEKANRFYDIANYLKQFNKSRNRFFCECVLGDLLEEEVVNISHYGMPTINSICIGSQWESSDYTLLTAPSNDIFLVHPEINSNNLNSIDVNDINMTLTPHGCGVRMLDSMDKIVYGNDSVQIGNCEFRVGESVDIGVDVSIRTSEMSKEELDQHIENILGICPGTIYGRLHQRFARTKQGDFYYREGVELNANNNYCKTR